MKGYDCPPGCVRCCEDRGCPVELTLGDVTRICAFLAIAPVDLGERYGEVMWNRVPGTRAFIPSLGLAFPCRLRVAGRCRIYQVRPLGCRLFPEAPALREDADHDLYRASGYPCFDRGVSVPPARAERIERLLATQREEARITATLFGNADYVCVLSPVELETIGRELDGVSPTERNARRRELCLARITPALKERARLGCLNALRALERDEERSRVATGERCDAAV
jgi:Fe-S-cluster containining protein